MPFGHWNAPQYKLDNCMREQCWWVATRQSDHLSIWPAHEDSTAFHLRLIANMLLRPKSKPELSFCAIFCFGLDWGDCKHTFRLHTGSLACRWCCWGMYEKAVDTRYSATCNVWTQFVNALSVLPSAQLSRVRTFCHCALIRCECSWADSTLLSYSAHFTCLSNAF